MSNIFNEFKYIQCKKNDKKCINKWSTTYKYEELNYDNYNYGILTGIMNKYEQHNNNITVVDIDAAGLEAYENYNENHGEIETLIIKTVKGYHLYFNYTDKLKTGTNIINGIDIRNNKAYVLAPGSSRNGEYYTIHKNVKIADIPDEFYNFLTSNKKIVSDKINKINDNNLHYKIINMPSDDFLMQLLCELDTNYLNDFYKWLSVLSVFKNIDKYDIFDIWSQRSIKYNKEENDEYYENDYGFNDINYLIYCVNQTKEEDEEKYKLYEFIIDVRPITINHDYKIIKFNQEKLLNRELNTGFTYDLFKNNDTLIIEAQTGTGKTTQIIDHILKYNDEDKTKKYKILSICAIKTMVDKHYEDFKKHINIDHYDLVEKININKSLVICINSLKKIENYEMQNTILFIDEISIFLSQMTHNSTLDNVLKKTYEILMHMIQKAHKVVVCQNKIFDNVLILLKSRKHTNKIFIKNDYIKDGNKCVICDKYYFYEQLKKDIANKKYFLFSCDSLTLNEEYYNLCKDYSKKYYTDDEIDDLFILVDSKHRYDIQNANITFLNKYVFYSPSIIYGVDFSAKRQNQYTYITGKSIDPECIYQQSMRTRDLETLYICVENIKKSENECLTLEATKKNIIEYIRNKMKLIDKKKEQEINNLINASTIMDENDELKIIPNTYFNLWSYNEYKRKILNMNKKQHMINILIDNKFDIEIKNNDFEENKINSINKKMTKIKFEILEYDENLYKEFTEDTDKQQEKYKIINDTLDYLNINSLSNSIDENYNYIYKHILKYYGDIIYKSSTVDKHKHIIYFFKSIDNINAICKNMDRTTYQPNQLNNIFFKIKLIKTIETKYNINILNDNFNDKTNDKNIINFDDNTYKLIKKIIHTKKEKPKNYGELKKMYVNTIKKLCGANLISNNKIDEDVFYKNILLYMKRKPDEINIQNDFIGVKLNKIEQYREELKKIILTKSKRYGNRLNLNIQQIEEILNTITI